jgi:cytochrome c553
MNRTTMISTGMVVILLFVSAPFAFGQVIPEDPTRGGQLFASKGCTKCHALKGESRKVETYSYKNIPKPQGRT